MGRGMDDTEWIDNEADLSQQKKRPSHIRACCAEGCTSKGYRLLIAGERVQYFGFPLFDKSLCSRWAAAVKLEPGIPYEKSYVCSKHFRHGDYKMKFNEDNKRTLRRTAIPSLEPVVPIGKSRKTLLYSDSDTSDDESHLKEITTLVSKDGEDGENFTVLVVKDTGGSETDEAEPMDTARIPENKKVPLKCGELLAMGPPYPWRHEDMGTWVYNRLTSHEEQLQKTRQTADEEEQALKTLLEANEQAQEILAHLILKKHMGRVNVFQHFKQLIT